MRMNGAQQIPWTAKIFLILFLSKKRIRIKKLAMLH